ncbi:MAG: T9SS type A sorting domain-containing protein [Chitinophagales bacterium]|nr:T9SS type A sorting domain-containing protein [Bacteroidota bacterium]MBP7399280.1 T9SS type A sorting domain-containing protein [Chitinophagales bacterium]MBP8754200.1 T9SS type A sorting domain-containing protein [Chitinophagales bacterium]MBP9189976.1 T9SS type A sorting domain-containing protein [Chitinophagales bacterium]MBP9548052.1 T9SS type A sorting domain-containing protein [Chitinophagales bacterium]
MKKFFYSFAIAFALCIYTGASAQWSYVNTTPDLNTTANELYEDASGNIITVGGFSDWPFGGAGPIRVTKHDASGNLIWEVAIESPSTDIGDISAGSVDGAVDGYVVFCGGYTRPLIIKLDFDGNVVWTSEAWSSGVTLGVCPQPTGYVQSDGTIVLASFDSSIPTQYVVFMVNSDGSLISEIDHSLTVGSNMVISGYDLVESPSDDGFAVSGGALQGGSTWMPYIWKFDSDGAQEWLELYPSLTAMEAYGICSTSDDGFAISAYDYFGGQTGVVKTTSDGTEEWSNNYNATSSDYVAYAYDIAQLNDGNYVMTHVNLDDMYLYYGTPEIVFIDSDGDETDRKEVAASESNWIYSIIGTSDGGFAFCGKIRTTDVMAPEYDHHFFVQKSSASGDLPACMYNCVWPGDANNDGIANTDDILSIGVLSSTTGSARDDMSIGWYAHAADSWVDPVIGGDENKYADCNGDGTINDDDTTAVSVNYSSEHPVFVLKTSGGEIPLFIDAPETELPLGSNSLPVILGDAINYADAIYGLRFTITYESENIESSSVSFQSMESWFGSEPELITFRKNNTDVNKLDVAIVRNNQLNATGNGTIGTLNFVVIDNIAGISTGSASFTISDVRAIDVDWNELAVQGSNVVVETEETTGIENQNNNEISIYPNPATGDILHLEGNMNDFEYISIKDITGRTIINYNADQILDGNISIESLPAGTYILEMLSNETFVSEKLIRQ